MKKIFKFLGFAAILAAIFGIASCKHPSSSSHGLTSGDKQDNEQPNEDGQTVAATGVSLSKSALWLYAGETWTLSAEVAPDNATNKAVLWTVSPEGIVRFDEATGKIAALAAGTATITVATEDGNFAADCAVTVEEKPAAIETWDWFGSLYDENGDKISLSKADVGEIAFLRSDEGWQEGCPYALYGDGATKFSLAVSDLADGKKKIEISSPKTIFAPKNSSWFFSVQSLSELDLSNFDTSNVTEMSGMFCACRGLSTLDLSRFDTSNVTDMRGMFGNCNNLSTLDVSGFDMSNVTDMEAVFFKCGNLATLDVSGFNTAKVTCMMNMFGGCGKLSTLDLSNFDTSNVTNMDSMFYGCNNLAELDVSGFDTSNVTTMADMFGNCSELGRIYVSENFKTDSLVGNSFGMFSDCTALVGGNGTVYDSSHTDKEYARIDADGAPGYFTRKE